MHSPFMVSSDALPDLASVASALKSSLALHAAHTANASAFPFTTAASLVLPPSTASTRMPDASTCEGVVVASAASAGEHTTSSKPQRRAFAGMVAVSIELAVASDKSRREARASAHSCRETHSHMLPVRQSRTEIGTTNRTHRRHWPRSGLLICKRHGRCATAARRMTAHDRCSTAARHITIAC